MNRRGSYKLSRKERAKFAAQITATIVGVFTSLALMLVVGLWLGTNVSEIVGHIYALIMVILTMFGFFYIVLS